MCGIAGFLTKGFETLDESTLTEMGYSIRHRGPDAQGVYLDDSVGMVHRRLSILDLSESGNQPMYSPDGNVVIVFNGEIYNFLDIKSELIDEGVVFNTSTDTEVILHAYLKMGTKCLDVLNGMFAFAIWDQRDKSLFIARDRIGKKPLYYLQHNGRFAFASEIKALLTLPDIPKEIRLDAVWDFFAYQYIPDPKSIFKHIHKLPPGHFMRCKNENIDIQQYWDVSFSETTAENEDKLSNKLEVLLEQCTQRRMISDVPLGAFLSGGIDSSGVVALMAKNSQQPVKTCTIAFDDKKFNEAEFAAQVADQFQTEHHEFTVHQNVKDRLEHIVEYFDEPFADPSLVPTFFVSELARQAVTVAIAGDGGDEIFAGYQKYNTDDVENRLRNQVPNIIKSVLLKPSLKILELTKSENALIRKARTLLKSITASPAMGFYFTNAQLKDTQWQTLVKANVAKALGDYHPSENTVNAYNSCNGTDHLSKILYTDLKTFLPGGILVKVDRMSMANSLEVRAPILDKEVIEFAATLKPELKFRNGDKKYILKKVFQSILPKSILNRPKMGFSVPLADWLRTEIKDIAHQNLIEDPQGLSEIFKLDVIKDMWNQHQSGKADHSSILWSMLTYELWFKRYAN